MRKRMLAQIAKKEVSRAAFLTCDFGVKGGDKNQLKLITFW